MNTSSIPFFTLEGHEDPVNAITFTSKNLLISGYFLEFFFYFSNI